MVSKEGRKREGVRTLVLDKVLLANYMQHWAPHKNLSHSSHAKLASCAGPRRDSTRLVACLSLNCRKSQVIDIIQWPCKRTHRERKRWRERRRETSNNYLRVFVLQQHVETIKLKISHERMYASCRYTNQLRVVHKNHKRSLWNELFLTAITTDTYILGIDTQILVVQACESILEIAIAHN